MHIFLYNAEDVLCNFCTVHNVAGMRCAVKDFQVGIRDGFIDMNSVVRLDDIARARLTNPCRVLSRRGTPHRRYRNRHRISVPRKTKF